MLALSAEKKPVVNCVAAIGAISIVSVLSNTSALAASTAGSSKQSAEVSNSKTMPKLYAQEPKLEIEPQDAVRIPRTAPPARAHSSTISGSSDLKRAAVQSPAASALERGKLHSRHGQYKDAKDFFTLAATSDPKNPEPYNRRARAEWQLEENAEALEDANWAIKQNPDYAEAFCTRAAIYNSEGKYQEAIADASMASDLKPSLREAYLIQATAYHNLGQHTEADQVMAKLNELAHSESAFDEWQPNVDYTPYLAFLQSTVRQNWQAPQGAYGPAVVLFKVHRSGSVSDVRLHSTTGDAHADSMAIDAVKRSAPFRQPPAGAPPDSDVYVVLEPGRPSLGQPQAQAAQVNAQAPTQKSPINWGGALNQGVGVLTRVLQFAR